MSEKKSLYNVTLVENLIEREFPVDADVFNVNHNVIKRIVYVKDIDKDKLFKGMNVFIDEDNILSKLDFDKHESVDIDINDHQFCIQYFKMILVDYEEHQH